MTAARNLTRRLFSIQRIPLGLAQFNVEGPAEPTRKRRIVTQTVVEFRTPDDEWERKKAPRQVELGSALLWHRGQWKPALSVPDMLDSLKFGTLCRFSPQGSVQFGRQVPVARFGRDEKEGELVLNRWLLRALRTRESDRKGQTRWRRLHWKLDQVEKRLVPLLPELTMGGTFADWQERNGQLYARLRYNAAITLGQLDSKGRCLISPPERSVEHDTDLNLADELTPAAGRRARTVADSWYSLGLIDAHGAPTRRGILFSFFNYGEGLAVAAALEDAAYAIEDLLLDLANLRAGHRFGVHEPSSGRLGAVCRAAYGLVTFPGYLSRGLPATYGEGAAEILFQPGARQALQKGADLELRTGDIERARLEWRSLVRHVAHCSRLNWDRWNDLQAAARRAVAGFPRETSLESLPQLTSRQRQRHKSFLTFSHFEPGE